MSRFIALIVLIVLICLPVAKRVSVDKAVLDALHGVSSHLATPRNVTKRYTTLRLASPDAPLRPDLPRIDTSI